MGVEAKQELTESAQRMMEDGRRKAPSNLEVGGLPGYLWCPTPLVLHYSHALELPHHVAMEIDSTHPSTVLEMGHQMSVFHFV